jgi:uncharacterized damage-inducible protein DinB
MTAPDATAASSVARSAFIDLEHELASTRRVLERVPDGKFDWKPHDKSMSLGAIAGHVAELPNFARMILELDEYDFATGRWKPAKPATTAEVVALFDETSAALRESVAAASDESLAGTWTLRHGGHVIVSGNRAALARTMGINHILHHRSQLIVYLRLLDVPVPGLYGPSADER